MKKNITRCKRCIMDDVADSFIKFDEKGQCNYCTTALETAKSIYFPGTTQLHAGNEKLDAMIAQIKKDGEGRPYDCIMGLSGGLDSSYLVYLGYTWGLRVLCVHIDDGFDTEVSKQNLQKLVDTIGCDYKVIKPDAEQYNDLTLAYMKAGVAGLATPQDNILFAFLFEQLKKYNIKYFLTGGNFALECILQQGGSHSTNDVVNIKDIHKRFGTKPINKLKFISIPQKLYNSFVLGLKTLRPLNYVDYNRDRAFQELYDFCGFEYYGRKHLENILTAFVQLYWLPKKFNEDKRTSHLSSMIVSGQLTREQALAEYAQPLYDERLMVEYIAIIKDKLHISDAEFEEIMCAPTHQSTEYKTSILFNLQHNATLKEKIFKLLGIK